MAKKKLLFWDFFLDAGPRNPIESTLFVGGVGVSRFRTFFKLPHSHKKQALRIISFKESVR